ncbi:MAG: radical SAM protein [Nanoarchaeota archaeon]|nr:radical SAM protein [Nanoarchaeota archaeon]
MIKRLNLQLTRRCDSNCSHCFGNYGPDSKGELTLDQAKFYIDQTPEHQTIDFNLTGGEPTLYPELINIIQYADQKREQSSYPENIYMFTNCLWMKGNNSDEYLRELKQVGLDEIILSIDEFRRDQQNSIKDQLDEVITTLYEAHGVNYPEFKIRSVKRVVPIRRGYSLPKDRWVNNRKKDKITECAIDYLASQLEEDRPISAFVSPTGLYFCGDVPEVGKIGELGEPLDVIEPRVRKIGKFIKTLSAFDPKVIAEKMNDAYGLNISVEHDCISCHEMFDKIGYGFIEEIIVDGSFEEIVDELMKELKILEFNFL